KSLSLTECSHMYTPVSKWTPLTQVTKLSVATLQHCTPFDMPKFLSNFPNLNEITCLFDTYHWNNFDSPIRKIKIFNLTPRLDILPDRTGKSFIKTLQNLPDLEILSLNFTLSPPLQLYCFYLPSGLDVPEKLSNMKTLVLRNNIYFAQVFN